MGNTRQKWLSGGIPDPKDHADDEEKLNEIEDAELDAAFPKGSQGRRNRRKGKSFERLVAKKLKEVYPEARRGYWQSRLNQAGKGEACDVEGTPWWVECKNRKTFQLIPTIRQCKETKDHRPWLIVGKSDRDPVPFAVMRFDELLPILALAESGNVMPLALLADYLERAYRCKNADELAEVVKDAQAHYLKKEQVYVEDED